MISNQSGFAYVRLRGVTGAIAPTPSLLKVMVKAFSSHVKARHLPFTSEGIAFTSEGLSWSSLMKATPS